MSVERMQALFAEVGDAVHDTMRKYIDEKKEGWNGEMEVKAAVGKVLVHLGAIFLAESLHADREAAQALTEQFTTDMLKLSRVREMIEDMIKRREEGDAE